MFVILWVVVVVGLVMRGRRFVGVAQCWLVFGLAVFGEWSFSGPIELPFLCAKFHPFLLTRIAFSGFPLEAS